MKGRRHHRRLERLRPRRGAGVRARRRRPRARRPARAKSPRGDPLVHRRRRGSHWRWKRTCRIRSTSPSSLVKAAPGTAGSTSGSTTREPRAVGRFDAIPLDDHAQVIETTLLGTLYGSYLALRQFRKQRRGTLINVGLRRGKVSVALLRVLRGGEARSRRAQRRAAARARGERRGPGHPRLHAPAGCPRHAVLPARRQLQRPRDPPRRPSTTRRKSSRRCSSSPEILGTR